MDIALLQAQSQLIIRQNFRLIVNQYVVHLVNPDGSHGQVVAYAQQKRGKLKEEVILYTDESKQYELARFKAKQILDVRAAHVVTAADGTELGTFTKKFWPSLLRSTWTLQRPGLEPATGKERSMAGAIIRRLWGLIPYVGAFLPAPTYHFDFAGDSSQAPVVSIERQMKLRDQYIVSFTEPTVDRRLGLCVAVAMDAIQNR
ncbi:hypothetical protein [Yinghuangia soli]|uniref:Uncharacterized protein n=1 Tax=Yinghuangia soli TaxID=2908204 RepID=A0AA41PTW1_9ACTN|nr:hypothetical protein [Yinghuangia soli]MCF2525633.1 hypothetical protein [Yinghuangia soli]